jgi:hypothetical protein
MKIGSMARGALVGACLITGGWLATVALADEFDDGPFAMPREVVSSATAFQTYMSSAARIDGGFADGDGVERGLKTGAAYEPVQLEEGMIAFGAIAALQDGRFVEGVEAAAGHGYQRQAFAERLIYDPYAATQVDGAAEAGERVEAALSAEAEPLASVGAEIKHDAYTVQAQIWSKHAVGDASSRLAEVKSLSRQRAAPSEADNQAMMQALADADPNLQDEAPAPFTKLEAKALALAAESVLGYAHGPDRERLSPLLSETDSAFCLKMAKLNLYQCMAVAGPQYEDIYCLGQHALYDTAQCVGEAAHGGGSVSVAMLSPFPHRAPVSDARLAARRAIPIDPN